MEALLFGSSICDAYSICLPKKAAADCASLISAVEGSLTFSPLSMTTAPITSPEAMMGNTTAALCSMPSIGCTLSSALASNLAKGMHLTEAVKAAKDYVTTAIRHGIALGKGHGPTHHFVELWNKAGIRV